MDTLGRFGLLEVGTHFPLSEAVLEGRKAGTRLRDYKATRLPSIKLPNSASSSESREVICPLSEIFFFLFLIRSNNQVLRKPMVPKCFTTGNHITSPR